MLIVLLGLSEVGKTTIAKRLCKEMGLEHMTPISGFKGWLEDVYSLPRGLTDDKSARRVTRLGDHNPEAPQMFKDRFGYLPQCPEYFPRLFQAMSGKLVIDGMVAAWKATQEMEPDLYARAMKPAPGQVWDSIRRVEEIDILLKHDPYVILVTSDNGEERESDKDLGKILARCPKVREFPNTHFQAYPKITHYLTYQMGLEGERDVLQALGAIPETRKEQQIQGIDGYLNGKPIQIKTSPTTLKTGNLCFELEVFYQGKWEKSWYYSDVAFWHFVQVGPDLYRYRMTDVRAYVQKKGWDRVTTLKAETLKQQSNHAHKNAKVGLLNLKKLIKEGVVCPI